MSNDAWKAAAMRESMKNKSTLVSLVHPLLLKANEESSALRDTKHFHPSSMCKRDWCTRETAYKVMGFTESNPERPKPFRTLNIFEEGNRIHSKWQGWFKDLGILRGKWLCHECEHTWYGSGTCESCQSKQVEYLEVPVTNKELNILGHADGHIIMPDGSDALIEIKSMGIGTFRYEAPQLFNQYAHKEITAEEMWKDVKRPFPSHLRQGSLYMYCTGIHTMVFIYEWKAGQDVKEFTVQYQPEVISDILYNCGSLDSDLKADRLPDRPSWAEFKSKTPCKYCAYKDLCWESS
jgi:hypothetical protein